MKQETVKEVAERYVDSFEYSIAHPRRVAIKSFINGAKWQQNKQDEFAIGFAEWCIKKRIDFFDSTEIGETYTIDGNVSKYKMKELLEIYKKEKGL